MRHASWDYSSKACYHVPICTYHRELLFGQIESDDENLGVMVLSEYGILCRGAIEEALMIYDRVSINHCVIMPNHVHILIEINDEDGRIVLGRFVS